MREFVKRLEEEQVGKVRLNEPLARHTTLKVGGPADVFVEPANIEGLKKTMHLICEYGVSWRAIGRGSNLLVNDHGIRGVVIKLGRGIRHMEIEGNRVRVGGGYPFVPLATLISKKGLSGLEFAAGIPGSVGGAVYMNAGAHGSDVAQVLEKALILYPDGKLSWLSREEMQFSYRTSVLQKERGICVEAVFCLQKGDREEIVRTMQENKTYRMRSQPFDRPCCGSVFRNPLPYYAGELIEKAGLKGKTIGGAQVSTMHANFIVNCGNAMARDVFQLISLVQQTVNEQFGIMMETEVETIDSFF